MRIGIDCRAYGASSGYMGTYMENFISYLEQNDDSNKYVLFFNDREFSDFHTKSDRFETIKTTAKTGSLAEQIIFPYELRKEKLDLMLFSSPNIPFLYFGKSIIILADLVSYFYPEKHRKGSRVRYIGNFILRQSIRKAQSVIVLSEVLKRDIVEIFDIHEEKIQIIPPMCQKIITGRYTEMKQFFSQENLSGKYILSVGDLREYKNIPRLLQAYNLLVKEDMSSFDLVLVGKENSSYHEARSIMIQLGIQSRVHIYNVLDEEKIGYLYQNASLYVLPSLYEGSEQTLLLPLAYNLPIASSILPPVLLNLSQDKITFFRPMSISDMYEAIKKSLNNITSDQKKKKDMSKYEPMKISKEVSALFSQFESKKDAPVNVLEEEKTNI